jgi:hypothetical protein
VKEFDDSLLDDREALLKADPLFRQLAMTGARIRMEVGELPNSMDAQFRPRGVLVTGIESSLIRAVLQPSCPVPIVAWPSGSLPAWVGSLDLVVAVVGDTVQSDLLTNVAEAAKRGAQLIVAAPADSAAAMLTPKAALLPTRTGDPLAITVAVLARLEQLGLGPVVRAESVAEAADMVAEERSPFRDLSCNPAKELALALAEKQVLLYGTSTLAAQAARRVAEALRYACGQAVLAASATELLPVVAAADCGGLFSDPLENGTLLCPVVLRFDDGVDSGAADTVLLRTAAARGVRVVSLTADADLGSADRYVALLQQGLYGAAYFGVALGASWATSHTA